MGDETQILKSSSRVTKKSLSFNSTGHFVAPYPNDLDCIYELDFGDFDSEGELLARIDVWYDLEETFDLLQLLSGTGQSSSRYNVLLGQSESEVFYVPVDKKSGTRACT